MKRQKGFNLIEMIIVIAIVAILLMIIVPATATIIKTTQNTTCQANQKTLLTAINADAAMAKTKSEGFDPLECAKQTVENNGYSAVIENSLVVITGACPTAGTYVVDYTDNHYAIHCTIHNSDDAEDNSLPHGLAVFSQMLAESADIDRLLFTGPSPYFAQSNYLNNTSNFVSIDSTTPLRLQNATHDSTTSEIKKIFSSAADKNGDLIPTVIGSWRIERGKTYPN